MALDLNLPPPDDTLLAGENVQLIKSVAGDALLSGPTQFAIQIQQISVDVEARGGVDWPTMSKFLQLCFENKKVLDPESWLTAFKGQKTFDLFSDKDLVPMLDDFLHPGKSPEIRVAAAAIAADYLVWFKESGQQDLYHLDDLMSQMADTLSYLIDCKDFVHARKVLVGMSQLAESWPRVFGKVAGALSECSLEAMGNPACDDLMLQSIVTFLAAIAREPTFLENMVPGFVRNILSHLLKRLTVIRDHDREVWGSLEGPGLVSLCAAGERCLQIMVSVLDQSTISESLPKQLISNFSEDKWESLHAALSFMAITASKCHEEYNSDKWSIQMNGIFTLMKNRNPCVSWAAINAVKELSRSSGPEWPERHHQVVLPTLVLAISDLQIPRIQLEALLTLKSLVEKCSANILAPHLHQIVDRLLKLLQIKQDILIEGVLEALASVAISSQGHFDECYNEVMTHLQVVLNAFMAKQYTTLLGKLMSCITTMWLVVGKEACKGDIQQGMTLMVTWSSSGSMEHGLLRLLIIQAWGSICRLLGHEFQPYMSVAIPFLVESAQLSTLGQEGERYTILVEEKVAACKVLCCCAGELKEHFYRWIDKVSSILASLTARNRDIHFRVREVAFSAMPAMLQSSAAAEEKGYLDGLFESPLKKISRSTCIFLVTSLREETLTEIRIAILESLEGCLQISEPFLSGDFMKTTVDVLTARWLKKADGGDGKEQDKIVDCFATFIIKYNEHLLPFAKQIFSCLERVLDDGSTKAKGIAMRIFREFAKNYSENNSDFHLFFEGFSSANLGAQQIAVGAICVGAEFNGDWFKHHIEAALAQLNVVLDDTRAEIAVARDFAISALGKICMAHHESIDLTKALDKWLLCLPMRNDVEEARAVHEQLCVMVERHESHFLSTEHNLPRVVEVFSEILWESSILATENTVRKIVHLLKRTRGRVRRETWDGQILAPLPAHLRQKVEDVAY